MNNNIMRRVFVLVAIAMAASGVFASATDTLVKRRAKAGTPIVPGQWHADFSSVKKFAEDNGLPLMAVWSNGDECSHCLKLERCLNHTTFYSWQKNSGIVFYFGYEGDKSAEDCYGGKGYNWCWKNQSLDLFPFVRYYWKAKKGTVLADGTVLTKDTVIVDKAYKGDTVDDYKDEKTGNTGGAKKVLTFTQKRFAQFVPPSTLKYYGGAMVFPDSEACGLQVEHAGSGVASVSVPIVRTNDTAVANSYTNYLVITKSGKSPVTNEVIWATGESVKEVSVSVDRNLALGSKVGLLLLDGEKNPSGVENGIYVVEPVENSPSNPYWIGEKTASNLGWGEWTMDIAVAKEKVKNSGGDATLILVGGSQWCPDCVAVDKWFIDTPEFKTWAGTTHKIACVAVDVPKIGKTTPSLLTYDANVTSERFYTYNYSSVTNEQLKVMSGAGYLSRHGVTRTKALEIATRNNEMLTNSVPIGLCRPECQAIDNRKTSQFKTGIPALILLRPDGTVAGRIYQFNNLSPSKPMPELVNRLEELVRQIDDTNEERNDDPSTLGDSDRISLRETVLGKTISAVDQADYYALGGGAKDQIVSVRVIGMAEADVTLSFVNRAKSKSADEVLYSKTGLLKDGVEISYEIPTTNCYVKVSYPVDKYGYGLEDGMFNFKTNILTECGYSLASDTVLVPQEEEKSGEISDGNRHVTMRLTEGQSYRITNLDESAADFNDYFIKGASDNIYAARETCSAVLTLTADSFTYRLWNTGLISFMKAGDSVQEKDGGSYAIEIGRLGNGSAGAAEAYLRLDPTSTNYVDLIEFDTSDENCHLTWADGDNTNVYRKLVHIVNNGYADRNPPVRFYLEQPKEIRSDAGLGVKDFLLTIIEDDVEKAGRLALAALDPLPSKTGVAYVREGAGVTYAVNRVEGTTGLISGKVAESFSGAEEPVQFDNRDEQGRVFNLTMPKLSEANSIKLTLTGMSGAKVDSSARTLIYKLVSEKAPEFEFPSLAIAATRYVAIESQTVKVSSEYLEADGELAIGKTSGSLPSGVKAVISREQDAITFSGVPSKAGKYTATYQVKKGKTLGLTLTVTVMVADPTVKVGALPPENDTIIKTRTFKDIRILDSELGVMLGVMDLTVPRTGKLSAKMRSLQAKSVTFSSKSWNNYDGGTFEAVLTSISGDSFTVSAKSTGTIELTYNGEGVVYEVPEEVFTAKEAEDYKGLYTISLKPTEVVSGDPLASGDGYVTLRMTTAGQVKKASVVYAGLLPNGKTFSGSGVLAPVDWDDSLEFPGWSKAKLPLFMYSTEDVFSGVLDIDHGKLLDYGKIGKGRRPVSNDSDARPYWRHNGKKGLQRPYDVLFEAFGGLYRADENFALKDDEAGNKLNLFFFADSKALDSSAEAWDKTGYGVTVTYTEKKKSNAIAKVSSGAASGFSLNFSSGSGVVSGSFRMPADNDIGYTVMSYRAVVLPGWGGANCADCGGTEEQNARPFICGSAWYTDKLPYLTEFLEQKGNKTVKENRGCAVSVGTEAGR